MRYIYNQDMFARPYACTFVDFTVVTHFFTRPEDFRGGYTVVTFVCYCSFKLSIVAGVIRPRIPEMYGC